MSVLTKLSLRQMKLNKRRTIVTIVGVIISVAMLTAVSSIIGSVMGMFQNIIISYTGDFHAFCTKADGNAVRTIATETNVNTIAAVKHESTSMLDEAVGRRRFIGVAAINPEGLAPGQVKLIEGRFPENSGEAVISPELAEAMPEKFAIGNTVTLPLGQRENDSGEKIRAEDSYSSNQSFIPNGDSRNITVTGVAEMSVYEKDNAPAFTMLTYLDLAALTADDSCDVWINMKQVDNTIFDYIDGLSARLGDTVGDIFPNHQLLIYSGIVDDNGVRMTLTMITGLLVIIIMIGSVTLIYNSFAISVAERSKDFGMLSGIGATKRQKRHMVLFEALVIGVIAIPIGVLAGLAGIGITFAAISPMLANVMNMSSSLKLVVSPGAIIAAIGFSALTLLISAWLPSRRAARFTPIEAIRQSNDIKLTPKAVKTSRLTRKLFGFEAEFALKNLKRNKRRYRTTLFSLIISLALFLSACSFTYYMSSSFDVYSEQSGRDIMTVLQSGTNKQQYYAMLAKLKAVECDSMTSYQSVGVAALDVSADSFSEFALNLLANKSPQDKYNFYMSVLVMEDEDLAAYAPGVQGLLDPENPAVVVPNSFTYSSNSKYTDFKVFKPGEPSLSLLWHTDGSAEPLTTEVRVASLSDKLPIGVPKKIYDELDGLYAVMSRTVYDSLLQNAILPYAETYIYMDSVEHKKTAEAIEDIIYTDHGDGSTNGYCIDLTAKKQAGEQMTIIINVFVFGFVTLISAIGIANIFNTISTGLILRKREFAMLRSVGMSPRGFRKMILWESLLYGIKSVIYGLPIGIGIMFLMYFIMNETFSTSFSIPWLSIVVGVTAIFAIVGLTMAYSAGKIKRENILDGLRDTNL